MAGPRWPSEWPARGLHGRNHHNGEPRGAVRKAPDLGTVELSEDQEGQEPWFDYCYWLLLRPRRRCSTGTTSRPYDSGVDASELVAAVCPKIRDLGWAFYFTPETVAVGESLGLDVFKLYFLGRGGALGDAEPEVVASAFGYFSPSLVAHMWSEARSIHPPRDAALTYMRCCADLGRARLSDIYDLDDFCTAADAVNDAADPVGLTLYAGMRSIPLVEDPPGRAMQLMAVLREFRGSAHLLAVRAVGLDPKTAHYMKRPNDMAMFGWREGQAPDVTDADHGKLEAAEALTDELVLPAYSVLDEAGRKALNAGVEAIAEALAGL